MRIRDPRSLQRELARGLVVFFFNFRLLSEIAEKAIRFTYDH